MIVLVRVDDRLIHGQVIVGWVNEVKANHIIVINDEIARDERTKSIMEIAVPSHIKVSFFCVDYAVEKLQNTKIDNKSRILILVNDPNDLLRMVKKGVLFKTINVGGMRFSKGKREILKSIYVDDKDIEVFKKLSSYGIMIEGRAIPTDKIIDIMKCQNFVCQD
jgi:mannose/fructose/sorbose-specific phosphotransferase system IIB component